MTKIQNSKQKPSWCDSVSVIEIWYLGFLWNLMLGIWDFHATA